MEDAQQENEGGDQAPLKTETNHATWEGAKSRSLEEISGWDGLDGLSLIFDGLHPTGVLITMKWEQCRKAYWANVVEIKRKTKKQQMRHHVPYQTPEPDNHYEFCLIP